MTQKIRPIKDDTQHPTSNTATLFAIMELPLRAGEKQVWRSDIYHTPYLAAYNVPACGVIVLDGSTGQQGLELYGPGVSLGKQGFHTSQQIAVWLGLPDLEIVWRRDYQTEERMGEHKRGHVVVPGQGFMMPQNGR